MQKTRLDQYLAAQHQHYSRTQIKKLIDEGFVLVDGRTRKPSFLLSGGENIEMVRRAPEIPKAEAEELPLEILYEDDDLMVINKAPGMVVHPAPGNITGTLVSAILHHLRRSARFGETRPGIVHRLDKGTSGAMVVAKNDQVQRSLSNQFKDRKVEKFYRAVVFGTFKQKSGTINKAIGRDTIHRRKFSSKTKHAREAVTHYEVTRQYRGLALLTLKLETGRTHQIRVHLSESGHPIVGDTLYGAKSFLSSIKDEGIAADLGALERPLLHSWRLAFFHPAKKGEKVSFEAPIPEDFQRVVRLLEGGE